jgi:molecular chaperone DnaJ
MKDIKSGDILVNIMTKEDKNITRKENDIYIKRNITLLDVYNNTTIEFIHIDNKKYDINLKGLPQSNNVYMVKELGMPILNSNKFGNLYITIYIELPNLINDQILKLNNILNNNLTEE